jgi:signal transduction histidine kinase/DNA-binding response OmpR family regulator
MNEPLRILLVDDDDVDRMAFRRALGASGLVHELREALGAAAAVAQLTQEPCDCVVTDLGLPRVDGRELIQLLRSEGIDTPVIVLTGQGDEKTAVELMKAGAADYIGKSQLTPDLIAKSVNVAVRVHRAEQARAEAQRALARHADQLARLQGITEAFSVAKTSGEVADVLMNQGVPALGAQAGLVALRTPDNALEVVASVGYPEEAGVGWGRIPLDRSSVLADAVKKRQTIAQQSSTLAAMYPGAEPWTRDAAFAAVPLLVGDMPLGVFGLGFATARNFSQQDLRFLEALARQCALALERARLYEVERAARTEAEGVNRAKDEFLSTLSHELRTPLNSIIGWVSMLRSRELGPEQQKRALSTIERNAEAQAKLIEDLLDVSRIISGKLDIERKPVEFSRLVDVALASVRPELEAKQLKLERELHPGPVIVLGDESRLQQVIWNLLSNAVKFTPEKGQLTVRLSVDNGEATVVVKDTGRGISKEFLPHVFERLRQAEGSNTRSRAGLGLGLAIVLHLVSLHGGRVQAASDGLDHGSTFTVVLPLSTASRTVRSATPLILPMGSDALEGIRILVVDDDADSLEMTGEYLEELGAEVSLASSPQKAREQIDRQPPDVLVSDLGMPGEDGYTFMADLRKRPPERGGTVPSIALTGHASIDDQRRARAAGFSRHFSKPVNLDELARCARQIAVRRP